MAANVAVTNTFTNGTLTDAPQVNTNFGDLVTWINANAVHLDGSKAFTGVPSYAGDPVSANHLCRKSYVDGLAGRYATRLRRVAASPSIPDSGSYDIVWDTEDEDTNGFANGTATITFAAAGIYNISGVGATSSNTKGGGVFVVVSGTFTSMGGQIYEVSAGATGKATFTNATGSGATTLTACSINIFRMGV